MIYRWMGKYTFLRRVTQKKRCNASVTPNEGCSAQELKKYPQEKSFHALCAGAEDGEKGNCYFPLY